MRIQLFLTMLLLAIFSVAQAQTSEISRLATAVYESGVQQGKLVPSGDRQAAARVQSIGETVARASKRRVTWKFHLVEDTEPQAFTFGEGVVVVSTGLLDMGLTDDELAGVLAHEVAHGTEQHTARVLNLQRRMLEVLLEASQAQEMAQKIQAETQSTDSMEYHSKMVTVNRKVSDIERKLKNIEGELKYQRQLKHSDEITADIVGLRYAVTAGYSHEGLGTALDKLLARGIKEFGSGHTGESLSHPPLAQRMTILKKVQADWAAGRVR